MSALTGKSRLDLLDLASAGDDPLRTFRNGKLLDDGLMQGTGYASFRMSSLAEQATSASIAEFPLVPRSSPILEILELCHAFSKRGFQ